MLDSLVRMALLCSRQAEYVGLALLPALALGGLFLWANHQDNFLR